MTLIQFKTVAILNNLAKLLCLNDEIARLSLLHWTTARHPNLPKTPHRWNYVVWSLPNHSHLIIDSNTSFKLLSVSANVLEPAASSLKQCPEEKEWQWGVNYVWKTQSLLPHLAFLWLFSDLFTFVKFGCFRQCHLLNSQECWPCLGRNLLEQRWLPLVKILDPNHENEEGLVSKPSQNSWMFSTICKLLFCHQRITRISQLPWTSNWHQTLPKVMHRWNNDLVWIKAQTLNNDVDFCADHFYFRFLDFCANLTKFLFIWTFNGEGWKYFVKRSNKDYF